MCVCAHVDGRCHSHGIIPPLYGIQVEKKMLALKCRLPENTWKISSCGC